MRRDRRESKEFAATSNGHAAVNGRTALVDDIALRLWKELISPDMEGPANFALVALGGFGRRWLFPYSDIDILFLHAGGGAKRGLKRPYRAISRRNYVGPSAEIESRDPYAGRMREIRSEQCGIHDFAARLPVPRRRSKPFRAAPRSSSFPSSCPGVAADRPALDGPDPRPATTNSANTVFHLEPNVKDGPGGLRDYNLAHWLALIAAIEEQGSWPDESTLLPASAACSSFDAALDFLMSVRCFLHFRHGRDDNTLAWAAQDEAAAQKIGVRGRRTADRRGLDAHLFRPRATDPSHRRCSCSKSFRRRARLCTGNFRISGRGFRTRNFRSWTEGFSCSGRKSLSDPELPLRTVSLHGAPRLESQLGHRAPDRRSPACAGRRRRPRAPSSGITFRKFCWRRTRRRRLRAMHSLRLLTLLLPEFQAIDALVIRDYSHRFTVDEHTFVAIENLHALRKSQSKWDQRYAELLDELEQPDLLYLALLLHDTGKGVKSRTATLSQASRLPKSCLAGWNWMSPTAKRCCS